MICDFFKRWSIPRSVSPVLLEQTEEGSPCVLMLQCSPCSPSAISRLLVISEARTMEVYSHTGEYCGTVRGEREDGVQTDRYTHTHTQLEHHLHVLVFYLQGLCLVFWSVLISFVCCQFLHLTSDSVWVWLMSDDVLKLCLLFFAHSSDRGPFYKKQLILEQPSSACEVKVSCVQRQNKHHFSLHTCKCLILHSW